MNVALVSFLEILPYLTMPLALMHNQKKTGKFVANTPLTWINIVACLVAVFLFVRYW